MNTTAGGSRGRLRLLERVGLVLLVVVAARLFWIQIVEHEHHLAASRKQHKERGRYLPHRGRILDRNGTPLAYSLDNPTVVAETARLTDPVRRREAARKLAPLLGMAEAELERLMSKKVPTVELNKKPITIETDRLDSLGLDGIRADLKPKRFYPLGAGAAHVTGFVGIDQDGIEGTERAFEKELQGIPGWRTFRRDAHGGRHPSGYERPAVAGNDLVLTIDDYLQEVTADRLANAVKRCNAKGGWAIVMDPKTGDILAMANVPTYDPTFFEKSPVASFRNHVLADRIEPGSTIKGITVAAALEEGILRPESPINCMGGQWMLQGKPITDHEKFGVLSFEDTFVHSSNVAMAQTGMKLGAGRMYHYLKKFGFGEKAGVGLPGEDSGYLKRRESWSGRTPATVAFGYEVQVTALQMALAYSVFANGGILMKPRLVKEIVSPTGEVIRETEPEAVRRVVTEATARKVLSFMGKVVTDGTGREAALDWCAVGGKTGTARKVDSETGQYVRKYYASFIGVAPLDDPRLLIYVVLDEPVGKIYGGSTAAPAFREIVEAAGKSPDPLLRPDFETVAALPRAADAPRRVFRLSPSSRVDLETAVAESTAILTALARKQEAAGDSVAGAEDETEMDPGPQIARAFETGVSTAEAPDLIGLTLRDAFERLSRAKLRSRVVGEGVVVRQFPAAGELMTPEYQNRVTLFFGDRAELPAKESK